ncbi:MAG: hypothetical protein HYW50_01545 [Candidatus Diapherotrites archaeon]|nr:hypothetical protein [Candidatus Diapherotrites archaeon]
MKGKKIPAKKSERVNEASQLVKRFRRGDKPALAELLRLKENQIAATARRKRVPKSVIYIELLKLLRHKISNPAMAASVSLAAREIRPLKKPPKNAGREWAAMQKSIERKPRVPEAERLWTITKIESMVSRHFHIFTPEKAKFHTAAFIAHFFLGVPVKRFAKNRSQEVLIGKELNDALEGLKKDQRFLMLVKELAGAD